MQNGRERSRFLDFLEARGGLTADAARQLREDCAEFREAIAVLAIRHGLVDPLHVEALLQENSEDFVDAAVSGGVLDPYVASRLRVLQGFRELQELVEELILRALLTPAQLRAWLADYLSTVPFEVPIIQERGAD